MTSTVEELKSKMAEIEARITTLRAEIATCEVQKSAFQTVIAFYEPDFAAAPPTKRPASDRSTPTRRVTDLLKGKDTRRGVLETLRDAEEPILATEIAKRYLVREDLEGSYEGLMSRLSARFAGILHRLETEEMVRATDAPDGRRRLWAIAR